MGVSEHKHWVATPPRWTGKVTEQHVVYAIEVDDYRKQGWTVEGPFVHHQAGAVDLSERSKTLRNAATLLEDGGTDEYVNPPTAEAMQEAAAELRALDQSPQAAVDPGQAIAEELARAAMDERDRLRAELRRVDGLVRDLRQQLAGAVLTSDNHALLIGEIAGLMMREGIEVEVIDDADGNHLDTVRVMRLSGSYLVTVRPEQMRLP